MGSARCPICGGNTQPSVRPFCSKRCREVDLHRWMSGGYQLPGEDGGALDATADILESGYDADGDESGL